MRRILGQKLSQFRRDERGIQLVELAITLPILILLFAAVAEFGRYYQAYTTLAKGCEWQLVTWPQRDITVLMISTPKDWLSTAMWQEAAAQ